MIRWTVGTSALDMGFLRVAPGANVSRTFPVAERGLAAFG
jgi:hypothetical protein